MDPWGRVCGEASEEEKSRRYFRSTKALWNLSSVAGLTSAPSFGIRRGLTNNVAKPSTKRSSAVRFGRALPGAIADEQLVLE